MTCRRHSVKFAYSGIGFKRESEVQGIFVGMSTFWTISERSDNSAVVLEV